MQPVYISNKKKNTTIMNMACNKQPKHNENDFIHYYIQYKHIILLLLLL
jgi:hypothetical protein